MTSESAAKRAPHTGVSPMLHDQLYDDYVAELARTHPRLVILKKGESPFCRFIDRILRVITFGAQNRFLTSFVTTFGRRIYVPDDWDTIAAGRRYCILRHEVVHVRQFRRWTWPGMTLLYVLLPLPVLFAGGRAWLEWQAYRETLVATWQVYGRERAHRNWVHTDIVERFTGPDYAWMWVVGGTIRKAIKRQLDRMEASPPPALVVGAPTAGPGVA